MKKIFVSLLLLIVCVAFFALDNRSLSNVSSLSLNYSFLQGEPFVLEYESFALNADSGALMHDLTIELSLRTKGKAQPMSGGLTLVTGELVESYCLLPNGEHFSSPARITIPYDVHRIPMGYEPNDVYSYYYDEEVSQWTRLERVEVDTINHTITSLTTHFTEFANAVIKVPEMPEAKAFVPTAMTDVPDLNPLQGIPMIAAPTANNRGTAELTYPIEVPKGRRGLQPNIDLHYSSASGNGILGIGWSMSVPAITIDTRWGVPRYDLANETEAYLVNGEQVLLHDENGDVIPLPSQANGFTPRQRGDVRFYARDTRNQNYIMRCGNDPSSYYWLVTDCSGTTYYYGYDPILNHIAYSSVLKDRMGHIAEWCLTAVVDAYGNYMKYSYTKTQSDIYLDSIEYAGNLYTGIEPIYLVSLGYNERLDNILDGRLGLLRNTEKLLCSIKIYCKEVGILSYAFSYDDCSPTTLHKSRLNSIIKYDGYAPLSHVDCVNMDGLSPQWKMFYANINPEKDEAVRDITKKYLEPSSEADPYLVPGSRTEFSYYDALPVDSLFSGESKNVSIANLGENTNYSFGGGASFTIGLGPDLARSTTALGPNFDLNYGTGRTNSMMIDLNGDGLPDYAYCTLGKVYYVPQMINGSFSPNPIEVRGLTRLTREQSFSYSLGMQASFGLQASITPISFSHSFTDTYFADVNNDRLPDLITSDGVYINRLDENMHPTFVLQEGDRIPVSNNVCEKEILRDGYVDPNLECINRYVERYTFPWAYLYSVYDDSLDVHKDNSTELNVKRESRKNYPTLEEIFAKFTYPHYKVVTNSDGVIIYELQQFCSYKDSIPKVDIVRVWVAEDSCTIRLNSIIRLLSDSSDNRKQSRTADGIKYYIQWCRNVSVNQDKLTSTAGDSILTYGFLDEDDYSDN